MRGNNGPHITAASAIGWGCLTLLLFSCSPQKRLARLVSRHPELVRTDTVVVRDTVLLPADTLVKWRETSFTVYDTVTVENEKQVVKWVRVPTGSPCDTAAMVAHIFAATKPDTVVREVRIPCDTVSPVKEVPVVPWWMWVVVGLLAAFGIFQWMKR